MSGIDRIVQVVISRQTRGVTRAGFGVPLILGPNALFTGVRTYRTLAAVAADFALTDGEYLAAAAMFSQTPRVEKIKIRKTSTAVGQVSTVTIASVVATSTYTLTIDGVPYTFISDADATAAEIQAGLIAAINANAAGPATAAASGGNLISLTAKTAGAGFSVVVGDVKLTQATGTANVGVASDLIAALAEDSEWYSVELVNASDVNISEAAKTVEAMRRILIARVSGSPVKSSATTDIASRLKAKGYNRTALIYTGTPGEFSDAAWASRTLPLDPGTETWAFKDLSAVTVDSLSDSEQGFLEAKNVTTYEEIGGLKVTQGGKVASGEYIDVIRGTDKLQARVEENVFGLLARVPKVPFTDNGIAQVESEIRGALKELSTGPTALIESYTVTVPKAADVAQGDKAARLLPDMFFSAVLQGAVHKVKIQGVVTL